jgi:phenylacetate-CoA ligase
VGVGTASLAAFIFGTVLALSNPFPESLSPTSEPGPKVDPPLRLRIEHGRNVAKGDLAALAERLRAHLRETLRITTEIEWLPPDTLPRQSRKMRLIEIVPSEN